MLWKNVVYLIIVSATGCGTPDTPVAQSDVESERTEPIELVRVESAELVELPKKVSVIPYCQSTAERRNCDSDAYGVGGFLFGAIGSIVSLESYRQCVESRRLEYLNVSRQVMFQFAENFHEHGEGRLPAFDICAEDSDLEYLRSQYGAITVFDFKIELWKRIEAPKGWPYNAPLLLRARLLDLESRTQLWEGFCAFAASELHSPNGSIVDVKWQLRSMAIECADRLAARFIN